MCSISMSFAKKAGLEEIIDHRDRPVFHGFGGTEQKAGMIYLCELYFTEFNKKKMFCFSQ